VNFEICLQLKGRTYQCMNSKKGQTPSSREVDPYMVLRYDDRERANIFLSSLA